MKRIFLALLLLSGTAFAQEDELIALLGSDAPLKDKSRCLPANWPASAPGKPCRLWRTLLADEQLSHRARFALEPIADPSVDAVLRRSARTRSAALCSSASSRAWGSGKTRRPSNPSPDCWRRPIPRRRRPRREPWAASGARLLPALQGALSARFTGPSARRVRRVAPVCRSHARSRSRGPLRSTPGPAEPAARTCASRP
jgi:hypothetical protein